MHVERLRISTSQMIARRPNREDRAKPLGRPLGRRVWLEIQTHYAVPLILAITRVEIDRRRRRTSA